MEEKLKFKERLEEFLNSELSDYSLKYLLEFDENYENCEVIISDGNEEFSIDFQYDINKDNLLVCMYEDIFEVTREFDWTVKYFWQILAPKFWK